MKTALLRVVLLEGYGKRHFKVDHRSSGQGLPEAKIDVLLDKLYTWGVTTHHDLLA